MDRVALSYRARGWTVVQKQLLVVDSGALEGHNNMKGNIRLVTPDAAHDCGDNSEVVGSRAVEQLFLLGVHLG